MADKPEANDVPGLNIVKEAKDKAKARIKELEPLVKEHAELSNFLAKLDAPVQLPQPDADPRPAPTPRAQVDAQLAGKGGTKKRRKRAGGTTADKAVAIIADNPGVGASEVAKQMGIKPNYLYRVLGDLEKAGTLKKDGRSYTVA